MEDFDENEGRFRQTVADAVNGQLARTDAGRKRQQTDLTAGNVFIVAPSPRVLDDGTFEVVFFVQSDSGAVINVGILADAVNETGATLAAEVCKHLHVSGGATKGRTGGHAHSICETVTSS